MCVCVCVCVIYTSVASSPSLVSLLYMCIRVYVRTCVCVIILA